MADKPKIGFIGLGIMGLAMAKNAKAAGFPVCAYNRSPERANAGTAAGLEMLHSPREVAEKSDAVVIMVTDPKAAQMVVMGDKGVFEGKVKGKALIQMSTLDQKTTLHLSRDAHENGMEFLDCPVAGSKAQVEAAQLIILAGGDDEIIRKWTPFFNTIGKAVVHAGEVGKGTALKLCMNLMVSQMTTALCESLALAHVLEVEPKKVFEVIGHSPALNCGYFKIKEKSMLADDFSPAFSLSNMLKDVRFMDQAAKDKRLPLPVTQAVRFIMEAAVQENLGDKDLTVISKLLKPKII